jgi:hypothetical protein
LVPKLAALADKNDEDIFRILSDGERNKLIEILKKITDRHGLTKMPVE